VSTTCAGVWADMWPRDQAWRWSSVVGTILVAINQGDVLLSGHLTALVAAKIGLTYIVPFSISTYSALARTACTAGEPGEQTIWCPGLQLSAPRMCDLQDDNTANGGRMRDHKDARAKQDAARFEPLRDASMLGLLLGRSQAEPVILFQHDPYCPISRRAYDELAGLPIEAALIDVAQHADISQLIESCSGVPHESPQVLVFRSGKVVWSASHYGITPGAVTRALRCATVSDAVEQPEPNSGRPVKAAASRSRTDRRPHRRTL